MSLRIFIVSILIIYYPQKDVHFIFWNKLHKLNYDDFKGLVDSNSKNDALSYPTVNVSISFEDSKTHFDIYAIFNVDSSWIRAKSESLLTHEQGHFDICEIMARKLKQRLLKLIAKKSSESTIQREINIFYGELKNIQIKYDKETNHGKNFIYQNKWNEYISQDLKKYQRYEMSKNEVTDDIK